MLAPLRDTERRDLTEVIEDRAERASTLIASQLPVTDWHAVHRRPQPGRRHLRPPAPRRAPHRAEGTLDATHARCARQPSAGERMTTMPITTAATNKPARVRVDEPAAGNGRREHRQPGAWNAHRMPVPMSPTAALVRRALWICRACGRPGGVASCPTVSSGRPQPLGSLADDRCRLCLRSLPRDSHSPTAHRLHGHIKAPESTPCTGEGSSAGHRGIDDHEAVHPRRKETERSPVPLLAAILPAFPGPLRNGAG